ncbi:ATP-grasp domain-containing protein [Streptomyces sp. NBC_00555]|uniref:ATP-grasp domain-containing protein n=1 Tax=Streptomyces sp. NBC_00555 TaxID=2903662 RepID=UPI002257B036|nr:ATP-grasp domain-containing protein [Streptomyces sp. NBC_00555]MCX5015513.1 ATP-grasp domain-containing protein [Streptomyces sp. NBC_00555]
MPEHVIIIHRWTDRYADYAAYIDHTAHRVSYLTTERAVRSLPTGLAAGVALVDSTENVPAVLIRVAELVARSGPPTRIVALQETDLDLAAELRAAHGLPGTHPADLEPLRDKLVMARRLHAAGLPAPATEPAPDPAAVEEFAAHHGWPVLVKPRRGTASAAITRLDDAGQLAAYRLPEGTEMIVQPWQPHQVLHVDGVYTGSCLGAWRASRYLNTCLEFTSGSALGSVEIDHEATLEAVGALTLATARALFTGPSVFHLELFRDERGELSVLEMAARPGGAEVPFVWREVHGIDLMAAAFSHQTGLPDTSGTAVDDPSQVAGWLLVPPSEATPSRVRAVSSHQGDGPYAEVLPAVGALVTGGGYEHAGARFRFRGHSTAEVEAAVRRTARTARLETTALDPDAPARIVVVGCGTPAYRSYSLDAVAARAQTALVQPAPADWQLPYVQDRHRTADTSDPAATTAAVASLLAAHPGPAGVLTWDETLLRTTAEVAARLGLLHMSPDAVDRCRDKLTTRRILGAAGVPSAGFRHVRTPAEALDAAEALGYPVVVKPRALAGSIGVTLASDARELAAAFDQAAGSSFPGITGLDGVIVEEYLTGPEISVDCAVQGGRAVVVNVARKRLGFTPYFEEVGHLVAPWRHEPWADAVLSVVTEAHAALGIRTGLTHTELRLTPTGPRVVEVNGRLGGDFIPLLGALATGVDLVAAACDIALGRTPDLTPTRDRCAEVTFVYPPHDGQVRSLDLSAAEAVPGVERAVALAARGTELLLPPRGIVPRLAALLVTGDTPEQCATASARAARAVRADVTPLVTAAG